MYRQLFQRARWTWPALLGFGFFCCFQPAKHLNMWLCCSLRKNSIKMELLKFGTKQSVIEIRYTEKYKALVNVLFPHINSLELEPSNLTVTKLLFRMSKTISIAKQRERGKFWPIFFDEVFELPYRAKFRRTKLPKTWLAAENFVRRKFLSSKKFCPPKILSAEILSYKVV